MGSAPPPSASAARRAQLADFLRTRRAAISPAAAGLPDSGRRRTPGLRREEVAQQAGVGLSWYTWLEQGRDVTPSAQVLEALSRALRLTASEHRNLFVLAGVLPPVRSQVSPELDDDIIELVQGLRPHIAYVLGPRLDIVAHNRGAEIIMGDLLSAPPERRNLLLWLFSPEAAWANVRSEWEATARANVLDFRTEFDRRPGDPDFTALVEELLAQSEAMRAWWTDHDVLATEPAHKLIEHPSLGQLRLLQAQTWFAHRPGLRLRLLIPTDEATRRALAGVD